ncbi:hypothetical protein BDW69DRAFT_197065 [Aspergillus filifer]
MAKVVPFQHYILKQTSWLTNFISNPVGIGRAIAERFVESGAKVTVVGRRKHRLDEFVAKYGNERAHAITFDLFKTDDIPAFIKNATTIYTDIDCVYFNAGTRQAYNLASDEGWDLKRFNEEVHLNFNSAVALSPAFLPFLKKRAEEVPASLISTGTTLAIIPAAWVPAYSASKAALNVFVLCLREHLKDASKLKIIEISPSAVQTETRNTTIGGKGEKIGMLLDQSATQAYNGLKQGPDQIIVGGSPDQEAFDDILKRRGGFENSAAMWRKQFPD